jgi:hypothetical protein
MLDIFAAYFTHIPYLSYIKNLLQNFNSFDNNNYLFDLLKLFSIIPINCHILYFRDLEVL